MLLSSYPSDYQVPTQVLPHSQSYALPEIDTAPAAYASFGYHPYTSIPDCMASFSAFQSGKALHNIFSATLVYIKQLYLEIFFFTFINSMLY